MLRNDCIQNHIESITQLKGLTTNLQRVLFQLFDDPFNIKGVLMRDIHSLVSMGLLEPLQGDYQIDSKWIPKDFRSVNFDRVTGISISHSVTDESYSCHFTYSKESNQ